MSIPGLMDAMVIFDNAALVRERLHETMAEILGQKLNEYRKLSRARWTAKLDEAFVVEIGGQNIKPGSSATHVNILKLMGFKETTKDPHHEKIRSLNISDPDKAHFKAVHDHLTKHGFEPERNFKGDIVTYNHGKGGKHRNYTKGVDMVQVGHAKGTTDVDYIKGFGNKIDEQYEYYVEPGKFHQRWNVRILHHNKLHDSHMNLDKEKLDRVVEKLKKKGYDSYNTGGTFSEETIVEGKWEKSDHVGYLKSFGFRDLDGHTTDPTHPDHNDTFTPLITKDPFKRQFDHTVKHFKKHGFKQEKTRTSGGNLKPLIRKEIGGEWTNLDKDGERATVHHQYQTRLTRVHLIGKKKPIKEETITEAWNDSDHVNYLKSLGYQEHEMPRGYAKSRDITALSVKDPIRTQYDHAIAHFDKHGFKNDKNKVYLDAPTGSKWVNMDKGIDRATIHHHPGENLTRVHYIRGLKVVKESKGDKPIFHAPASRFDRDYKMSGGKFPDCPTCGTNIRGNLTRPRPVSVDGVTTAEWHFKCKKCKTNLIITNEEILTEKSHIPNVRRMGRLKVIRIRIRNGKVQRRKKLSAVKGYTTRGGRIVRMTAMERRHRKLGARRARIKRRSKRARINMKLHRALRRRRSLGL